MRINDKAVDVENKINSLLEISYKIQWLIYFSVFFFNEKSIQ